MLAHVLQRSKWGNNYYSTIGGIIALHNPMILNTFDFITCKISRQIIARQDNLLGKVSLIHLIILIS